MRRRLAILTLLGIFCLLAAHYIIDPNRRYTVQHLVDKSDWVAEDNMLSSLNVTCFAQDSSHLMWIGTSAGINVYNGKDYTQFFHDGKDSTALPDDYINVLHCDPQGHMWIGTQNGVATYVGGYRFRRFRLPTTDGNILSISNASGDHGGVIVSNRKQSFKIDANGLISPVPHTLGTQHQAPVPNDPVALAKPSDLVAASCVDVDGNLWIGYRNAGYQVLSDNMMAYKHINNNPLAHTSRGNDVVALTSMGATRIAGTTRRLYIYDSESQQVGQLFYKDLFGESSPLHCTLNNIVPMDNQHVWIVGNRQIVSGRIEGHQIHTTAKAFRQATESLLLGCGTRIGDEIFACSSQGYIVRYQFGADHIDTLHVDSPWMDEETQMAALPGHRLLLFMKQMHLAVMDVQSGKLTEIKAGEIERTENINPAFVRIDSRGQAWLGTKRSGLYRLDMHSQKIEQMPFPDDVHIQALVEDHLGQIWVTTLKDLVCFQPTTGAVLMNSLVSSSQNNWPRQYFDNSLCLTPDGNLILGSSDGCIFLPSTIAETRSDTSHFGIYAMEIKTASGKTKVLNDKIVDKAQFTLGHDENDLTLNFFHLNYAHGASLRYQYMLEGYDQDWCEPTYNHKAHFANLHSGHYTFRLRLLAAQGHAPIAEQQVKIMVKTAPWNCAAAWMLYIMCAAWIVWHINSLYLHLRTNKLRLQHEHNEWLREQHTNEMNMSFFANISHEFRNPITIIAGPLLSLSSNESLPISVRQSLHRVCLSVNRMLRLIDQMLDFNQLETDALRLKVAEVDAAKELTTIVSSFEETTRVRGIGLTIDLEEANYQAWIDTDKLEKIVSNLFTNALKHTPDNGVIAFRAKIATQTDGERCFRVELFNSGSHIAEDRLADVFKRYYQLADANASHKYGWGTGLGLYYVKRLVALHHGEISVRNVGTFESGVNSGVTFTFSLPTDKKVYSEAEFVSEATRVMQIPVTPIATEEKNTPEKKIKILVVDDDVDVAQYIRSLFTADYVVENRYSAEAALADMADLHPDIVLSDIIMGEMSGFEFCRTLKSNLMYSHIPVILITAKSDMAEQINGLQLGAVAYVTKPFDPAYLCALVKTQLNHVQRLRQQLSQSVSTNEVTPALSEQDRKFMDELYGIMERRASELELSVAVVCHDMLISQSKFNYKVKELTGETPGAFFRKYKLNKAAQLLRSGRYNISEVAVMTGFSTPAHFSVAFKKQFGVVPSEYSDGLVKS